MSAAHDSETRPFEEGVSDLERIAAVFSNPDLYTIADDLVPRDPTKGGHPRVFPEYLFFAYDCLADIYTSARAVATALKGPHVWAYIRWLVTQQCPDDPAKWLPESPPSRTWYIKRCNRIGDGPLEVLRARFRDSGIGVAHEIGLLDPDGPGSPAHPDASRMIYHDGKAIRQLFNGAPGDTREVKLRDPETGEIRVEERPVRADPDAKVHITGDHRQVHGCKFWHAEARGDDPFTRVTLAVDHVPGVKGQNNSEPDIAVKNLLDLLPRVLGAIGTISDTAFRGTHIDALQRAAGRVIVAPVAAQEVDPKTKDRTEKARYLRTVTFSYDDGTTEGVDIWTSGGRLGQQVYTDDGTPMLVPLARVANLTRPNDDGTFRTYVQYRVPCPRGGAPKRMTEATYQRQLDGDFNRPENIRQIPPGDPDYTRLMARRSDAESANRQIDDHLYLRRARSLGAKRQLLDLIAHFFVENSIARYRHRLATGPPQEAAA
jgi:hypothetical protein